MVRNFGDYQFGEKDFKEISTLDKLKTGLNEVKVVSHKWNFIVNFIFKKVGGRDDIIQILK